MRHSSDDQMVDSLIFSNRILLYVVVLLAVVCILLGVGLGLLGWYTTQKVSKIEKQYFASGPNGSLYQLTPLNAPMGGDEQAISFTTHCMYRATRLDYVNYLRQLSETERDCFTGEGYKSYRANLDRTGITSKLKDPKAKLVMSSNIGPGEFLVREPRIIGGVARMTYTLRFPMDIVFNGDTTRPFQGMLEVDVLRVDETQRPEGLAIHAIRIAKR